MSDPNQPGNFGDPSTPDQPSNPYGQPPANPYGQPPANPYGQPPAAPQAPQESQPPPYGAQPPNAAPAQYTAQYAQPGQPYGESPGYGLSADPDKRPGTVTAAGIITLVLSGLTLALGLIGLIGLTAARDDFAEEINRTSGLEDIDPDAAFAAAFAVLVVFLVWCLAAMILAVLAMRRSSVARILLIISAVMTALVSLLAIASLISAVTMIGAITVTVLLLTGGAGQWYAGKGQPPVLPTGTTQPWG